MQKQVFFWSTQNTTGRNKEKKSLVNYFLKYKYVHVQQNYFTIQNHD